MCKVNKNATLFKKIFTPIDTDEIIAFSDLPQDTIAQKIYKLRMINNCTQREFSKKCNIGYSSLCKYELGSNPSNENLGKICEALNIDFKYFRSKSS